MKTYIIAAAAVLTLGSASYASDLPQKKAPIAAPLVTAKLFDWSGAYIGINVGYGKINGDIANVAFANPYPGDFGPLPDEDGKFMMAGGLVGGQMGYNYQTGNLVLGLEADLDYTGIKGSYAFPNPNGINLDGEIQSIGTARVRLGYAVDNILLFATGGVAYGTTKAMLTTVPAPQYTASASKSYTGYAVGAGIEYGLTKNWTIKTEYLYVNLGKRSNTYVFSGADEAAAADTSLTSNIVRVGLNYKF